jgi:transcriptional regulator with XRE-family HTH domain
METKDSNNSFDARSVRALLAAERITGARLAYACGLSRAYLSHVLTGHKQPGELARIKLERGLKALGLDREADHAA